MSRSKKTTKTQMELIVDYLENNRIMVSGKSHPLNTQEIEQKWLELTNKLNEIENGARKDVKQWKAFLYEWKCKAKKKARTYKHSITQTGGGIYKSTDLTDLENRLINVLGWVHIIGCPDLPKELELGHEETSQEEDSTLINELVCNENIQVFTEDDYTIQAMEIEVEAEPRKIFTIPKTVSGKKSGKGAKKQNEKNSNSLQQSAELYSASTEQMALAVKEMAVAISHLAEALSKIAVAITNTNKQED